jgi:hypothetical protein
LRLWLAADVSERALLRAQAGVNQDPAGEPEASQPAADGCRLTALIDRDCYLATITLTCWPVVPPACLQRQPGIQGKTNWHKS